MGTSIGRARRFGGLASNPPTSLLKRKENVKEGNLRRKKISFFGHFDQSNLGNESTLQAILYNLRLHLPDAEISCICTGPEATAASYNITAIPIRESFIKPGLLQNNLLTRLLRKILIGIPIELYQWLKAFWTLKGTDMLIVPGTGLLTDAYGLLGWGPYNMFKYSLIAKLCRCKLLFVSVGAGPIYGLFSRWLVKSALFLADFRSYRDNSSLNYLKGIGFVIKNDRVYPDLAFSFPEVMIKRENIPKWRRPVVGLGLMDYAGRYSVDKPNNAIYLNYLENLVIFVIWLLENDYDIRLLIGDIGDRRATRDFRGLLGGWLGKYGESRIIDEPASSVGHLLSQIAATDVVVATRFHNLVLSLVLNKPVLSISFHHKCASLMNEMGLSEYCLDINSFDADGLIEKFCGLEKKSGDLRHFIRQKTEAFRKALDEQYSLIFKEFS